MGILATLQQVFSIEYPLVDPAAFAAFYEQAHPAVFRYVYMLHGGPPGDVEDITAEVFARAWARRQRFAGSAEAALGWVVTIARRLVIDQQRRQRHRHTSALDEAMPADHAGGPEQHAILRERERLALDLLARVSLEQRDLLILRYFLDWRVRDIARHLGRSEGAVSVSIHRALRALRAHGVSLTAQEAADVA
jgi:RNA polymerase sigma-70 factor, ECF subfamily